MNKTISINNNSNVKRKNFIRLSNQKKGDESTTGTRLVCDQISLQDTVQKQNLIRSPEPKKSIPMLKFKTFIGTRKKRNESLQTKTPVLHKKELDKYLPTKIFPVSPLINKKKITFKNSGHLEQIARVRTHNIYNPTTGDFDRLCRRNLTFGLKSHNTSLDDTKNTRASSQLATETVKNRYESLVNQKFKRKVNRKASEGDKMKLLYTSFGYRLHQDSKFRRKMISRADKRFNSIDACELL
ncbi:unnamed protein product [Moneuplotes crassus]|uniref:Uncharacterized protein n=1 Tax=Euplotes crassus TaxID=5936 RepID=A0AAD1Y644_EUPCR|nr:unnamed protein product [Moneuplotes crassus]